MPPKLLDRRSSFSSTSTPQKDKSGPIFTDISYDGTGRPVRVHQDDHNITLDTKPCVTCGREITPRKKWISSWSEIKFCSIKCRAWKSVVIAGKVSELKPSINASESIGILERCLVVYKASKKSAKRDPTHEGMELRLHIDAWIEATMMHLIKYEEKIFSGVIQEFGGIPLEEVSKSMHRELELHRHEDPEDPKDSITPQYITRIRDQILTHDPGEREKIRRAARRLVVFPLETSYYAKLFGIDTGDLQHIALYQNHGRNRLQSLSAVSRAKMEIYFRSKPAGTN